MLAKIKWIWTFYRRHIYVLFVLVLLTPIQTLFQVTIPKMFGFSIDFLDAGTAPDGTLSAWITSLGETIGLQPLASFGAAFILLGLISSSLYAFVQTHRAWMNCRLELEFRQQAFDRVTRKGPDFFNKFRTGDLVTRMTDDVAEKLSWFACSGIFRLYEALLAVVFIVIMMIGLDPWLTLWTAGPLPLLIMVFFRSSSALDKRYERLQERISLFNDVMEACFSGIRVVKAYVREKAQYGKFDEAAQERRKAEIASVRLMTVVDSLYMYIWQFALVIVLVIGGYKVINSGMSVGMMATFIYYVVYLVFPMFDIGQFLVKSRQSAVSINRLTELESFRPMVPHDGRAACSRDSGGDLTLERVSFAFPDSERQILDSISVDIKAGETVAVVGKVGSGKSWLVNLLPRLVDPTVGRVQLDGRDLRDYEISQLRSGIGYVPQEPVLFSDTVRSNILLGRDEISESVIEWAVEVAQLKDEIATFPKGIDTQVGTRGMSLSGGQKQRLALARALVGKPRILVLDDCTSALDSRTETALWDRLHEVMPGMTAILITHRPDTLERVDRIYVLEDGRVVETGRHHDLLQDEGVYARIYKRYQLAEAVARG
ncbi:MAG: ABC transporter ATP-binding protein/permease [candidate division Zixibacteria bacterium]|nr:ABC transporter ATP-binding protein/permease [candidate division Zixibacteria bacterium]